MSFNIAIDGTSASGKTEVSKRIAKVLKIVCVDSGAIYRAITLYCIRQNIDIQEDFALEQVLDKISVDLVGDNVFLNGKDVSEEIRQNEVSNLTSIVAKNHKVREFVTKIQREIANKRDVVMHGRDITSVVLKDAELKIYLNATPEVRAKRRQKELEEKNEIISFEKILDEINKRDERDMKRDISPLVKTEDSIEIDTTNMNIDQVVEKIISLAKERGM